MNILSSKKFKTTCFPAFNSFWSAKKILDFHFIIPLHFQTIFGIPIDKNNVTLESIEFIVQSQPEFFSEEPECLLAELPIIVNSCNNITNFSDISRVAFRFKN